jgi:threonine dehydrogenase-like Zn-dependent dehydrogenase
VDDLAMKAAILHAPGRVSADEVPDPAIHLPTDAIVRVTASCICGSDLWPYRGQRAHSGRIGHEFIGVVEDVGSSVAAVRTGDVVIAPFMFSCGNCPNCRAGWTTSCLFGGDYGGPDRDGYLVDGGQGEFVRVPLADGTLVPARVPEDDERIAALLTLSDVMGTGHHAAVSAGVREGRHGRGGR